MELSTPTASGRTSPAALASIAAFLVLPTLLLVLVLARELSVDAVAVDFQQSYYPAAELLLDGESPYQDSEQKLNDRTAFVYPVLTAVLVAPLTVLPPNAAGLVWTGVLLGALMATLAVVGVRDWRLYGLVLLWPPTISALQTGNVTLFLGLLCALAWRYRDRSGLSGIFIGTAAALKLFLWSLVVWLLAARHHASAAIAIVLGSLSALTVLPFLSLRDYLSLLRALTDLVEHDSYTLLALSTDLGIPETPSRVASLAIGGLLCFFGRKSFVLCLAAGLLVTPIVWLHYFALLAVPLAVTSAPLWAWSLPLFTWLAPGGSENGAPWQTALVLVTAAATIFVCARRERLATGRTDV